MKRILLTTTLLLFSMSAMSAISAEKNDEKIAQEKIQKIMSFYLESAAETEKSNEEIKEMINNLEKDLEGLSLAKKDIELRKNLIEDLYVDIKNTKNLYTLEFDENGDIKEEISKTATAIIARLGEDTKVVKVKLSNGKMLPLIKYKVKKDDTLKKILLNTYPEKYNPTWNEVSQRIDTLVKINKNIIKMNYIYPNQKIYIPLFKDNPTKDEIKENIINQKKKKASKI